MVNEPEPTYINIEPNWRNLRLWALNGMRSASDAEMPALAAVLAECELAKRSGRPDTDWNWLIAETDFPYNSEGGRRLFAARRLTYELIARRIAPPTPGDDV